MTTTCWLRSLAFLAVLMTCAAPGGPAAAQSSEWATDFGPLVLALRDGGRVTGLFPTYNGRVEATLNRQGRTIDGIGRQGGNQT